jgi:very-short-patch-repair endonuclease
MAFGFVGWTDSKAAGKPTCHAPLLLVPIKITQDSAVAPARITTTGDDVIVNPTFSYKLNAEFGFTLPKYADEPLEEYTQKVAVLVGKLKWQVTNDCKIGTFAFQKINMYRDIKDNAKAILANKNIQKLLGGAPTATCAQNAEGVTGQAHAKVANPLIELHNVVDADSSQLEAIQMARSGTSFVLQGPPGTGKSQTITNIIAECLYSGKKVLFVSEKQAALNVVYNKLQQANLTDFCLELHSNKASKKEVISELCRTLRAEKPRVSPKAKGEIEAKQQALNRLNAYEIELHKMQPVVEQSLYQLYEGYSAHRKCPDVNWPIANLTSMTRQKLAEATNLLEQYVDYIDTVGYNFKNNPWYGYINFDSSFQSKAEIKANIEATVHFLEKLVPAQNEVSNRYIVKCNTLESARKWKLFFTYAEGVTLLAPSLFDRNNLEAAKSLVAQLRAKSAELLAAKQAVESVFEESIYAVDCAAYHQQLIKLYGTLPSRLFNDEYKNIISDLRLCMKHASKPSYEEAVELTRQVTKYQALRKDYASCEEPLVALIGPGLSAPETNWDNLEAQLEILESHVCSLGSFGTLQNCQNIAAEQRYFSAFARDLQAAFDAIDDNTLSCVASYFSKQSLDFGSMSTSQILARLKACLDQWGKLDNWCHFRNLLNRLKSAQLLGYIEKATAKNVPPDSIVAAFKKQYYLQWIDAILSKTTTMADFNRVAQDKAVRTFAEKDIEQLSINQAVINAKLAARRPSLEMITPGSPVTMILREGEKKRKQKNIRQLMSEAGELIREIKPCFLMSPLSVSTFLDANFRFDVVIFDEASQIFPQDAVGAIYRADQLIVVGDSKQMPPTNFFMSMEEIDDDSEEVGDITDFESLLDICSTCLAQLSLLWHYRSRCEELIAFSNKNFYNNTLVTFPSTSAAGAGKGVEYVGVPDNTYKRKSRTNETEAKIVVDLIYKHFEKHPDHSLGVVAFNRSQQQLIERMLDAKRQECPKFESYFSESADEPFFIKSLETVQGDERDTIIFSVTYGRDTNGRLLLNFGPLNGIGGERRLNVAITRAKYNVKLVSSMKYTDIDLSKTSSNGVALLREYLDYAQNGKVALERNLSVNKYDHFDSDFELEVAEFLREKGFAVDTQVGCSGFRIDLGLKVPDSSKYVLAIECDGATYHSSKNARDRDRLRQEVLEQMGWTFYRIWSTDWFRNKDVEKERLMNAAKDALARAGASAQVTPSAKVKTQVTHSAKAKAEAFIRYEDKKAQEFPAYKMANIDKIMPAFLENADYKGLVKQVLLVEAPVSEAWLLYRTVKWFGAKKVTGDIVRRYIAQMSGCEELGIVRRGRFLYLAGTEVTQLRVGGGMRRKITLIAPEELAAGMRKLMQQGDIDSKERLFRVIEKLCGVDVSSEELTAHLEKAYALANLGQ